MSSGDHQRAPAAEDEPAESFRHGEFWQTQPLELLGLRVVARNRVSDDHQVGVWVEVSRIVAFERLDLDPREQSAHRRIEGTVRSADSVTAFPQQTGQGRHPGHSLALTISGSIFLAKGNVIA